MRLLHSLAWVTSITLGSLLWLARPAIASDAVVEDATAAVAPSPSPSPAPPPPPPPSVKHWYGGRLLLADTASLAVLLVGAQSKSSAGVTLGLVGWFVASPIVHASHAGAGRGVGSLALRVGLPLAGFLLARSASEGCWREPGASDACDIGAEAGGVLLGALVAEAIDVIGLANDDHPIAPARAASDQAGAQLVFAPQAGGALMGVTGRF